MFSTMFQKTIEFMKRDRLPDPRDLLCNILKCAQAAQIFLRL
jgi:hypothetical protein